jgi:vacuolar-type H+-ATPase subunit D/Vma8
MSDYTNPFEPKPIEKVKNDIHAINRNINQIKMDIISMRSDISIIKQLLDEREKEKTIPISKGWIWNTY